MKSQRIACWSACGF